jgi:FdhE protein
MTAGDSGVEALQRRHPEWSPWLAVIRIIQNEIADPKWNAAVPRQVEHRGSKVPLLDAVRLELPASLLRPSLTKLIQTAARSGSAAMESLRNFASGELDSVQLFRAALRQDSRFLKEIAANRGADAAALEAVVVLLPLPFLQACNRAWEIAPHWLESYCPICGSWPVFAEIRGIERNRYLRCGRCGSGWQMHGLTCPYCGMGDHNELLSLVPEKDSANGVVDACKRCFGYLKAFTKLQGSKPADVMLDDLASVALDIAAAEHGYKRPQGTGYLLNVTIA